MLVYYLVTVIVMLFVPFDLTFSLYLLCSFFSLDEKSLPLILVVVLAVCFVAMALYGHIMIKNKNIEKPDSMKGIYLPAFIPLIWFLLCAGISNILDLSYNIWSELGLAVLTQNLWGCLWADDTIHILQLDRWHVMLVMSLVYYFVLILGFAVGERHASRALDVKRKPFRYHKKFITISLLVVFSAYSLSEFVLSRHRENILDTPRPSYNFSFEKGYSSIDLSPYYVENEENILARLDEPSTFLISDPDQMPVMDGAEAAYPVYSAFANACYEDIGSIQENAKKSSSKNKDMPIQFTNTIYAYEKLLTGEVDIFFGAKPSGEQLQMAEDAGVELVLTPIAKEGFVFFVNIDNPVDGLSSEQIRDIYSGKVENWRKVGGKSQKILAFQRPENSGSQTMMKYFMGDVPLKEPLEREYETGMGDVYRAVADYESTDASIGYSFRYYTTIMMAVADSTDEVEGIKLLALDGVYPDPETIRSGEYPLTTELYAITVKKDDAKDTIEPFLAWMTGPQGQKIVENTGYVALE